MVCTEYQVPIRNLDYILYICSLYICHWKKICVFILFCKHIGCTDRVNNLNDISIVKARIITIFSNAKSVI